MNHGFPFPVEKKMMSKNELEISQCLYAYKKYNLLACLTATAQFSLAGSSALVLRNCNVRDIPVPAHPDSQDTTSPFQISERFQEIRSAGTHTQLIKFGFSRINHNANRTDSYQTPGLLQNLHTHIEMQFILRIQAISESCLFKYQY